MATKESGFVFARNAQNKTLLVGKKVGSHLSYPGGTVESGELASECAKREFLEETGAQAHINSDPILVADDAQIIRYIFEAIDVSGDPVSDAGHRQKAYFSDEEIIALSIKGRLKPWVFDVHVAVSGLLIANLAVPQLV